MPKDTSPSNLTPQLIPIESIERRILLIRGHNVMLDRDLAKMYGVSTKVFNQAVKRNRARFPKDFMFRLSEKEASALRSQFVALEKGRGRYPKYAPHAFTEQGVAMLSSVLRSKRAIQVNIAIMRVFVRLRQILATHQELAWKIQEHDRHIKAIFEVLQKLLEPPPLPPRRQIGFTPSQEKK